MLRPEIIEPDAAALAGFAVALETRNLSRTVGDKLLVNDISVRVHQGEVLALVGPSGAGKSSFLRLINRLDEPTGGTVLVNGRDYREIEARELRRRVGMVMQMAYLFPGTVAANIEFGPRQRHQTLSPARIAALLERVGLPGYEGCKALSTPASSRASTCSSRSVSFGSRASWPA
jgi:putative ABC transport system ATP-binding protein